MRRVSTADLEANMIVGRTVSAADGRPLLSEGMLISEKYIQQLKKLGIGSVYIKDEFVDVEIPQTVSSQVLNSAADNLKTAFINISANKAADFCSLRKGISRLLDEILSNRQWLVHLDDVHSYDDYLYFHSVNVTVLSMVTGLSMGYSEGDVLDLGMGALLHDIGMITIDQNVVNKVKKLTAAQMESIKKHPETGFNMLRGIREVSVTAAHIAYQHHERFDGTGYPRQMLRKHILEYARISSVADTYDAIISDHPYRKGYSAVEAVTIITKLSGTHFDPDIVDAFLSNIAIYPVGSMVLLNTGHVAVVTTANRFNQDNPVIQVICDQNGKMVKKSFKVDLSRTSEVVIIRALPAEESDTLCRKLTQQLVSGEKNQQVGVM